MRLLGAVQVLNDANYLCNRYDTLAPLEEKVKDIRIKNPIVQHIAGMQGEYRQENVEKQRTYNLPQWRQLCEGAEHQPPARRGERRKGQVAKEVTVGRRTRSSRKSTVAPDLPDKEKDEDVDDEVRPTNARKRNFPTPPEKLKEEEPGSPKVLTDSHGRQPRVSAISGVDVDGGDGTPEPLTDSHGRQPRQRKKYVRKTAKAREAEQAMLDDEAFEGFDYRITNADEYTPERCEELEKAYWRTLTYSNPLYGADMPGSLFDDRTTSWNVAHLENLLDCLGKKLPGVNTAYLYLGMWRSTFAWHLEDMDLYSINYIHFGAPKQWYSISRSDKAKFEEVMKSKLSPHCKESQPALIPSRDLAKRLEEVYRIFEAQELSRLPITPCQCRYQSQQSRSSSERVYYNFPIRLPLRLQYGL